MTITAEQVKALRDRTGAGMMDCKTALIEADGDMEAAIDILRKKGLAQAAKRAGRTASEGLIGCHVSADGRTGVMVEVNCETDFVAKTDDFKALVAEVTRLVAAAGDAATPALLTDPAGPIAPRITAAAAKTGEKVIASRLVRFAGGGQVGSYLHLGGKIGVLVEFAGVAPEAASREEFRTLAKEVAMQVAAASPLYARREDIPAEAIEREKAVYRGQLEGSKKPANVIEKIIEGKLGSFYEQVVLPDQASIRDPKVAVRQVIATAAKALGGDPRVVRFARLRVGESA